MPSRDNLDEKITFICVSEATSVYTVAYRGRGKFGDRLPGNSDP